MPEPLKRSQVTENFPTPLDVADGIRDTTLRYIDTAFWLKDSSLMNERRALLDRPGALVQDVFIEPVMPYDNVDPAEEVFASVGLTPEEADLLAYGVFGAQRAADLRLRRHQSESLRRSLRGELVGSNPVVTSGTGSGKTESFLLPMLARLLVEAREWRAPEKITHWWSQSPANSWVPLRSGGRPAALRAVVLYPTNALVEDQLARLRRSVQRIADAGGPLLWFGRYTSATPGGTTLPKPNRADKRVSLVGSIWTRGQADEHLGQTASCARWFVASCQPCGHPRDGRRARDPRVVAARLHDRVVQASLRTRCALGQRQDSVGLPGCALDHREAVARHAEQPL